MGQLAVGHIPAATTNIRWILKASSISWGNIQIIFWRQTTNHMGMGSHHTAYFCRIIRRAMDAIHLSYKLVPLHSCHSIFHYVDSTQTKLRSLKIWILSAWPQRWRWSHKIMLPALEMGHFTIRVAIGSLFGGVHCILFCWVASLNGRICEGAIWKLFWSVPNLALLNWCIWDDAYSCSTFRLWDQRVHV